jgi:hypothetical protein
MYAIEGVNALPHPVEDVPDPSDTKKMHWPVVAQLGPCVRDYIVHGLAGVPEAAPDGDSEERVLVDKGSGFVAQIVVYAPLHDAIQRLLVVVLLI